MAETDGETFFLEWRASPFLLRNKLTTGLDWRLKETLCCFFLRIMVALSCIFYSGLCSLMGGSFWRFLKLY